MRIDLCELGLIRAALTNRKRDTLWINSRLTEGLLSIGKWRPFRLLSLGSLVTLEDAKCDLKLLVDSYSILAL